MKRIYFKYNETNCCGVLRYPPLASRTLKVTKNVDSLFITGFFLITGKILI
jgi:hypothetical protein